MIKSLFRSIFKEDPERYVKQYRPVVDQINQLEGDYQGMSDAELKEQTGVFRQEIAEGMDIEKLLPKAFAVVREAGKRVLNMRHFDVQLIGGLVLYEGAIAEMRTGEGKTLVATLPAYLNAILDKSVYVVTVNDYLAKRDSEWMGQLFLFLGITTGLIQANMAADERKKAYQCDVVYGTNNEFGFDYLRDNLASSADQICQASYDFAIVDEVDSILIDEARTPLIISGAVKQSTSVYKKCAKLAKKLVLDTHFTIDEKHKNVVLLEEGVQSVEDQLKVTDLYSIENMEIAHIVVQCLKSIHLYTRDVDYVVQNGDVMIVDEFTGRLMEGRRFSDGLHQSIEAVEGVKIQHESQTLASVTFQNYFRMFDTLSGMTGTALTEAAEFEKIYDMHVVPIPTNQPVVRTDHADVIYKTQSGKFDAIVKLIQEVHEKGQPLLVGTISIEHSELVSEKLKKIGLNHNVLNAKHHAKEADIVKQAGQFGQVTIATNMAGRGTDIVLGDGVLEQGGLFIIGSERHESRRIDNQLRGRSGRQGDPGESRFFVSLEDNLMRMFGSDRISRVMGKLGMPEDMPIEHGVITRSLERAQTKVEKYHFSMRKQLLEFDNVMNKQRETIYAIRRQLLLSDQFSDRVTEFLDAFLKARFRENQDEKKKGAVFAKEGVFYQSVFRVFPTARLDDLQHKTFDNEADLVVIRNVLEGYYNQRRSEFPGDFFDKVLIKQVFLDTVDRKWVDHLHQMDILKEGIGLRAYGQRDPLLEYKMEAFDLFEVLMDAIAADSFAVVSRAVIVKESVA